MAGDFVLTAESCFRSPRDGKGALLVVILRNGRVSHARGLNFLFRVI